MSHQRSGRTRHGWPDPSHFSPVTTLQAPALSQPHQLYVTSMTDAELGVKIALITHETRELICLQDLTEVLGCCSCENPLVWSIRIRRDTATPSTLAVRHFPDGKKVGSEGSIRDTAGGRHFTGADVATWLKQEYPSTWSSLSTKANLLTPPEGMKSTASSQQSNNLDSISTLPQLIQALAKEHSSYKVKVIYPKLQALANDSGKRPSFILGFEAGKGIKYRNGDAETYLTESQLRSRLDRLAKANP